MPHDKFGSVVEVGQIVIVKFRVTAVFQNETFCNVNLESVEVMPEGGRPTTVAAINTRQVEILRAADWRTQEVKDGIETPTVKAL